MHPLERLCRKYGVSLYALSQGNKSTDNTLRSAIRNNADMNNLTFKTIKIIMSHLMIWRLN